MAIHRFAAASLLAFFCSQVTAQTPEAYKYDPIPHLGQFDYMVMGAFTPFADDTAVTAKYYGLPFSDSWPSLLLHDASGNFYTSGNWVYSDFKGGLFGGQWAGAVQGSPKGSMPIPNPHAKPWTGPVTQEMTPDKKLIYRNGDHEVIFDEKSAEWKTKSGDISLKGELATPGIGFLLPWRDPSGKTDMMYYTAQYYKVEGTFYGVPVKGYIDMDQMWGNENYRQTWWVQNRIGHWDGWNTEYADGTSEMGHFLCGEYGARGAIIVNDKGQVLLNTKEMRADVTQDADKNITRIVYTFGDGQKWQYIEDPNMRRPRSAQPLPQVMRMYNGGTGQVTRVGETRKVVRWWSQQFVRGKMCDPSPSLR